MAMNSKNPLGGTMPRSSYLLDAACAVEHGISLQKGHDLMMGTVGGISFTGITCTLSVASSPWNSLLQGLCQ